MTKAEFDIEAVNPDPGSDKAETSVKTPGEPSDPTTDLPRRRFGPVMLAGIATILWVGGIGVLLSGAPTGLPTLEDPAALLTLIGGVTTPVAVFWLIALAFQRTDPTLERRLALSKNLHKALAPVEIAERRFDALNQTLRKELKHLSAVADLASDRIDHLENRFQEQVSGLFGATADAEARATSIADSLSRERRGIDELVTDMEIRFARIEEAMKAMRGALKNTAKSTQKSVATARTDIEDGTNALSDAAGTLEDRLNSAVTRFEDERSEVERVVGTVDSRLEASTSRLHASLDRLSSDMDAMSERSTALTADLDTQSATLQQLVATARRESETIQTDLTKHLDTIDRMARDALSRTDDVSQSIDSRATAMIKRVGDAVEAARDSLFEAASTLETSSAEALEATRAIEQQAMTSADRTLEALKNRTSEMESVLSEAAKRVESQISDAAAQLEGQSRDSAEVVRQSGEGQLTHLRDLRTALEQQLDLLRSASLDTAGAMTESIEKMSQGTTTLLTATDKAKVAMSETGTHMDDQTRALEETLSVMHRRLRRFEDDLKGERASLMQSAEDASSTLKAASEMLAGENRALGEGLSASQAAIQHAADALSAVRSALNTENDALLGGLGRSRKALGEAAGAFTSERLKIRNETDAVVDRLTTAANDMGEEVTRFTQSSFAAVERLEDAGQRLQDRTSAAEGAMTRAAEATRSSLSTSMDDIAEKAGDRITALREEMQATLDALLKEYRSTVELAERESAHLAMRLGREADKIAGDAQRFIDRTEEVQRRLTKKSKADFSRTAALIMESLQSSAIDIFKALSVDVPDAMWDAYLAGDKSIFARRTVRMADRRTRRAIADRYKTDAEFREAASRFMADFQGLIERAMTGDRGNALSVALISSDMGKLYVLLGQALNKIS